KMTGIPTFVVLPTSITNREHLLDETCVVIGISSTGTSKNTIDAIEYAKSCGATGIDVTNDFDSPYGKMNQYKVFLDHGEEDCSPKSKSYVCEMVTLCVCALEYALAKGRISQAEYDGYVERLSATCRNLDNIARKSDEWYDRHQDEFRQCYRMLFVGYGANKGTIEEAALKVLETGRFQTAWYELEEFMHGIYHSIHEEAFMVYLASSHPQYFERTLKLKEVLSPLTEHQFVICKDTSGYHDERSLDIDFIDDEDFYFIEYIIPTHIISYRIATGRGINPNKPSDPQFHQKMSSKLL
ncbi:MAG: hypothetical protein II126_04405, partial [Erysipelotrichaceae bacterium]|nr:hypothetical protein [Erysipelotrichaceae bacterium]